MSEKERYGTRDLTYSDWHRTHSTKRFLGARQAFRLGAIDIDDCEYDRETNEPLALIEVARDVGQSYKPAHVMARLAQRAGLPAWVALFAREPCALMAVPCVMCGGSGQVQKFDISGFRVAPAHRQEWQHMDPAVYARWLLSMREDSNG